MDMEMITPYLPMSLLGLLGVFLLFGMLFGLGRGLKRSSIRLATVLVALLITFFVTPFIIKGISGANIVIVGKTPTQWLDVLVEQMQQSGTAYLTPLMPYLKSFALALAVAVVNLVLFLALYFVVKMLSWIVYAIIAHCCAPKKDKDGKRLKKYALWGMLVGAVQGLVLFFFFMIPFNGLLGVAGQVAQYQTLGGNQVSGSGEVAAAAVEDDDAMIDVIGTAKQIDDSVTTYKMVLRFTGLEWLSRQAFNYEMTVRMDGSEDMCLGKDLVTGLELVADWQAMQPMFDRVSAVMERTDDLALALAELNDRDYEALRYVVNKAFSLEVLNFGDVLLTDLDQILGSSYDESAEIVVGTENWSGNKVYQDSCYAYLMDEFADPAHRAEFMVGVRAMVDYWSRSTANLVKQDLLTMLNAMQALYTAQYGVPVANTDEIRMTPVAVALTRQGLTTAEYLDILLAPVDDNQRVLDVILSNVFDLQFFQTLAQPNADNFLLYSNLFDDMTGEADAPDTGAFLRKFMASFMGANAIGTREQPGAWWKLRNLVVSVLDVARDHVHFADDLKAIQDDLRAKAGNENASDAELLPQAILTYLSNLLNQDATDDAVKYAKVDRLAVALHDVVFTFDSVADFAREQVTYRFWDDEKNKLNDLGGILESLLNAEKVEDWQKLLRSATNMANLLTKSTEVIDALLSVDFSQPDAVQNLLEKIVGTDDETALIAPDAVAEIVYNVLHIEQIGDTVNQVIKDLDLSDYITDEDLTAQLQKLQEMDVEEITEVVEQVWQQVRDALSQQGA